MFRGSGVQYVHPDLPGLPDFPGHPDLSGLPEYPLVGCLPPVAIALTYNVLAFICDDVSAVDTSYYLLRLSDGVVAGV